MEAPKLIITEAHGQTPMLGMCSKCRALFPTLEANARDRNIRLLERVFQVHARAEHSDHAPSWNARQSE